MSKMSKNTNKSLVMNFFESDQKDRFNDLFEWTLKRILDRYDIKIDENRIKNQAKMSTAALYMYEGYSKIGGDTGDAGDTGDEMTQNLTIAAKAMMTTIALQMRHLPHLLDKEFYKGLPKIDFAEELAAFRKK